MQAAAAAAAARLPELGGLLPGEVLHLTSEASQAPSGGQAGEPTPNSPTEKKPTASLEQGRQQAPQSDSLPLWRAAVKALAALGPIAVCPVPCSMLLGVGWRR